MSQPNPWSYPEAARCDQVDVFPGETKISDPYRWLEDPDSEQTKAFVTGQNTVSSKYIAQFAHSEKLRAAIKSAYSYEKFSAPRQKADGYWYYFYNPGLLSQSQIWRSKKLNRSDAELFFDPNKLSSDGTVALSASSFSKDGKYFAYSTSKSGSDNQTIYIKDTDNTDTLQKHNDELLHIKFSGISWTKDNAGFTYHRYPAKDNSGRGTAADINSAIYYHKLGTLQDEDVVLHNDPANPHHMFGATVSDDGEYMIITASQGTEHTNKMFIAHLGPSKAVTKDFYAKTIVDDFRASFDYITNYGSRFIFMTNENAPRNKLVVLDYDKIESGFTELVPESADVLDSCVPVNNDKLILTYTHDVKEELSIYSNQGKFITKLDLPVGLAVYGATCNHDSPEFFITVGGFTTPLSIYKYSFTDSSLCIYRETDIPGLNAEDYTTEQIFFNAADGTKIPMFITGRKDLPDRSPVLQYGYGGFQISVTPSFSILFIILMKYFGARVAVVNIRGGGEYGREWWSSAIKANRRIAFTDFQRASEVLIEKYTSSDKLAIYGGSNGGLLCGVCLNQRPELYGAVMAAVGVLDMLRFNKFTIGAAWESDYGSPEDEEMFPVLKGYSPLHNVNDKEYPATLLLTADHDDRVVPSHTLKFAAELQFKKRENEAPLIARVEVDAGHGAGKPTEKKIDEYHDQLAFLATALKLDFRGEL